MSHLLPCVCVYTPHTHTGGVVFRQNIRKASKGSFVIPTLASFSSSSSSSSSSSYLDHHLFTSPFIFLFGRVHLTGGFYLQARVLLLRPGLALAQCLRGSLPGALRGGSRGSGGASAMQTHATCAFRRSHFGRIKRWSEISSESTAQSTKSARMSVCLLSYRTCEWAKGCELARDSRLVPGGFDGCPLRVWWCAASACVALAYGAGETSVSPVDLGRSAEVLESPWGCDQSRV